MASFVGHMCYPSVNMHVNMYMSSLCNEDGAFTIIEDSAVEKVCGERQMSANA